MNCYESEHWLRHWGLLWYWLRFLPGRARKFLSLCIKQHLFGYNKPRQRIKNQTHHSGHKGPSRQSYGFSSSHIWMWELDHKEGWVLKNWYFCTVVLEKTLESPLDCKESNQSILKEISLEYSLEGLMLKVKLQSFGHLMGRADLSEKTVMLGKTEGGRRRRRQRIRWLDGITDSMNTNLIKL